MVSIGHSINDAVSLVAGLHLLQHFQHFGTLSVVSSLASYLQLKFEDVLQTGRVTHKSKVRCEHSASHLQSQSSILLIDLTAFNKVPALFLRTCRTLVTTTLAAIEQTALLRVEVVISLETLLYFLSKALTSLGKTLEPNTSFLVSSRTCSSLA